MNPLLETVRMIPFPKTGRVSQSCSQWPIFHGCQDQFQGTAPNEKLDHNHLGQKIRRQSQTQTTELKLGHYLLHEVIGSGGMGTVYLASDLCLQRQVAIKVLHDRLASDPALHHAFLREARACAALSHPHIISIFSLEKVAGQSFLVMELAGGGNLHCRVEDEGPLPEWAVLDLGIKIASALVCALRKGILHRDINPGNILFCEEENPKLADFGLAGSLQEMGESDTSLWATPGYVAPEKVRGKRESFLSDLYSLAGTLYYAITGRVPFETNSVDALLLAHLHQPIPIARDARSDISRLTSDVLVRAMAKNPYSRFRDYKDFISHLAFARQQLQLPAPWSQSLPSSPVPVPKQNAKKWPWYHWFLRPGLASRAT